MELCIYCDAPRHYRNGMCKVHYMRWRKAGNRYPPKESPEALLRKLIENPGDACIEWPLSTSVRGGYGRYRIKKKSVAVHRKALEIVTGYLDPKAHVCHTCDNPPCCNPKHLYAGDYKTNAADTVKRGRRVKGSQHHNAKLVERDVSVIKGMLNDGVPQKIIAAHFFVSTQTIRAIKARRIWKHVII